MATLLPPGLAPAEERMLRALCDLDTVGPDEALRRALRLAFFARLVPDTVLDDLLGERDPDADWQPTGEVRVDERGRLVAGRRSREGAEKWVPATAAEVEAWEARRR